MLETNQVLDFWQEDLVAQINGTRARKVSEQNQSRLDKLDNTRIILKCLETLRSEFKLELEQLRRDLSSDLK